MVTHTSHYAIVGAIGIDIAQTVASAFCGSTVSFGQLANPATLTLAGVAIVDVISRHLKDILGAKIAASVPDASAADSTDATPAPAPAAPKTA